MATSSVHCVPAKLSLLSSSCTSSTHDPSSARFPSPSPVGLACPGRCLSAKGSLGGPRKALHQIGIERDLPESYEEDLRTAGEGEEDSFPYGYADGHHTFHKEDGDIDTWEAIKELFVEAGGPRGFQAYLAWGSLPTFYLMLFYGVQVEYIFLAVVLFIFAFIGIEMDKPEQDFDFPPEVYKERKKKRMEELAKDEITVL